MDFVFDIEAVDVDAIGVLVVVIVNKSSNSSDSKIIGFCGAAFSLQNRSGLKFERSKFDADAFRRKGDAKCRVFDLGELEFDAVAFAGDGGCAGVEADVGDAS